MLVLSLRRFAPPDFRLERWPVAIDIRERIVTSFLNGFLRNRQFLPKSNPTHLPHGDFSHSIASPGFAAISLHPGRTRHCKQLSQLSESGLSIQQSKPSWRAESLRSGNSLIGSVRTTRNLPKLTLETERFTGREPMLAVCSSCLMNAVIERDFGKAKSFYERWLEQVDSHVGHTPMSFDSNSNRAGFIE